MEGGRVLRVVVGLRTQRMLWSTGHSGTGGAGEVVPVLGVGCMGTSVNKSQNALTPLIRAGDLGCPCTPSCWPQGPIPACLHFAMSWRGWKSGGGSVLPLPAPQLGCQAMAATMQPFVGKVGPPTVPAPFSDHHRHRPPGRHHAGHCTLPPSPIQIGLGVHW
jgi:hypothetical protein